MEPVALDGNIVYCVIRDMGGINGVKIKEPHVKTCLFVGDNKFSIRGFGNTHNFELIFEKEVADEFLFRYRTAVELHLMQLPKPSFKKDEKDKKFSKTKAGRKKIENVVLGVMEKYGPIRPPELKKRASYILGKNVERGVELVFQRFVDSGVLIINDDLKLELVEGGGEPCQS
ncbi:MAG: hypothetical protein HQ536_03680 [Parcubacteria group bacterium]|nr:hypothetical protein [Parcubacteria group bacterium]